MRTPRETAHIHVTTSLERGVPLSKERIALYNSGLVPIERYQRDSAFYRRAGAESLRIDLGWGAEWMPRTKEVVQRDSAGNYSYHFEQTDEIARLLTETGTRPYWSYCYVPAAARDSGQTWMAMGADDTVWVDTVREYVRNQAGRKVCIGYHEVYNEPDLRDERTGVPHFYEGGLEDYLDLYRATSRAIREGDPSARVGGPALALTAVNRHWLEAFLDMVVQEDLPLDFLSVHHYGHFSAAVTLDIVDEILARYDLPFLEVHLNEYNSFAIDYPRGGLQDTHFLASAFAADIPRLLNRRGLTRTHWAQFQDSGPDNFSGMIDIDGDPKPIWHVYEFYQWLPTRQSAISIEGPDGVGAIAGADDEKHGVLIWNRSQSSVNLSLTSDRHPVGGFITILDSAGVHRRSVGEELEMYLERGAVAMVASHDLALPPGRMWRGTAERLDATSDGWIEIDERSGAIEVATGSNSISATAYLETARHEPEPHGWTVRLDGTPGGEGTVIVTAEGSVSTPSVPLRGAVPDDYEPRVLDRTVPDGAIRYRFDLLSLPPHARLSISPEPR